MYNAEKMKLDVDSEPTLRMSHMTYNKQTHGQSDNILSRATSLGAPLYGGVRTCVEGQRGREETRHTTNTYNPSPFPSEPAPPCSKRPSRTPPEVATKCCRSSSPPDFSTGGAQF